MSKIPTLPKKLINAILAWEYTDLADLLPEQLSAASSTLQNSSNKVVVFPESSVETHRRRKRQITDITTWVKVYAGTWFTVP